MKDLVACGAGYTGSHTVKELIQERFQGKSRASL